MTRKGKALYEQLIPRLLRKEQEIMSCLSLQEQNDLARLLGKIENSLGLVQTSREAEKTEAVLKTHYAHGSRRRFVPGAVLSRFSA